MAEDTIIDRSTSFRQQAFNIPMLAKGEDRELGRRWQRHGDVEARNKLVESHLRFAKKWVAKYARRHMSRDDIEQEAYMGLMQAAEKYNPDEKDFAFSTYAYRWILASINEQKMKCNGIVKYGTTSAQKAAFFGVPKYINKVQQHFQELDFNKFPDAAWQMLADLINEGRRGDIVSADDLRENTIRAYSGDKPLDAPAYNGETMTTFVDTLVDTSPQAKELVEEADEREWRRNMLVDAFQSLNTREQDIITRRRLSDDPATLEDMSEIYELSKERIRQIEEKGLGKLRKAFISLAEYRFGYAHPVVKQLSQALEQDPKFKLKI